MRAIPLANPLCSHAMNWTLAALLPLPILLAGDPANNAELSCLYLGIGCGWLTTEIYRAGALPVTIQQWRIKMLAIAVALATNVSAFMLLGLAVGVQSSFPFPLMAILSAIPAIGMTPWLVRRVRRPQLAFLLAGLLVLGAKLSGCVVARVVYGPDYIAQGYVSDDWRTAKLMISLFWILSTAMSAMFFVAERINCKQSNVIAPVEVAGEK
jgi:hypothetical protein